jgi:hypothetical protein
MSKYTEYIEGKYLPIIHDTDSKFFDLVLPPSHMMDAENLIDYMAFNQSLVPEPYKSDPELWSIYDLDDYQLFVARYIQMKVDEENGKSIYPQDRPFITREA